jgi:hypothetical protein
MGVLQDFERRLEGAVEGFFARALRSGLQPIELAKAVQRYAEDHQHVTADGVVVPNVYRVQVSEKDHERLSTFGESLPRELGEVVVNTAADRGWTAIAAGRSTEHLYRPEETDGWLKIAEAASAECDDPDDALFLAFAVRANRGVWLTTRRPAEAIACYEGCMERALALGEPGFVGGMRCNLASAMLHMGRIDEARTVAATPNRSMVGWAQ